MVIRTARGPTAAQGQHLCDPPCDAATPIAAKTNLPGAAVAQNPPVWVLRPRSHRDLINRFTYLKIIIQADSLLDAGSQGQLVSSCSVATSRDFSDSTQKPFDNVRNHREGLT